MEPPPLARYLAQTSNRHLSSGGGSSSRNDIEEVEIILPKPYISTSKKLKTGGKVVPHDIIEIEEDDDTAGVLFIGENINTGDKGKETQMGHDYDWKYQDASAHGFIGPTSATDLGLMNDVPYPLKNFGAASQSSINLNKFSSDLTYDDDDDGYDDYDDKFSWQTQLDAMEKFQGPLVSEADFQAQFDAVDLPPWVEASIPWLHDPAGSQGQAAFMNGSPVPSQSSSSVEEEKDKDVLKKLLFKQFDTVQDYSDHHYSEGTSSMKQPSKSWTRKIQEEWKILEKNLPDAIFVRVYESRMDLLRAVIIGAAGTPYHDGLFFFDVSFPSSYPNVPPQVYYHSGGLRLNPNLYGCGKVCLSLLNTWSGNKTERWTPGKSTVLQVLVSIQALVLNAKPFFNEPGYESMAGKANGEIKSQQYNESTFILSLRTMLFTLKRPPKHFECFVKRHFRKHARDILVACRAYMQGAQVGCLVKGGVQDLEEGDKSCSSGFKRNVADMVNLLVPELTKSGAKDCEQFYPSNNVKNITDTTLKL